MTTTAATTVLDAYLTCALWSETDDSGLFLVHSYSIDDIDAESIEKAHAACLAFLVRVDRVLPDMCCCHLGQFGHDLWLTRNGKGAGFSDRPKIYGGQDIADTLASMARSLGECSLSVGDDGKLSVGAV